MEIQEKILVLESEQNELYKVIRNDGHAIRCQKTGQAFAEAYPEEYAAYESAYAQYQANKAELAELYRQKQEQEQNQEFEE